MQRQNMEYGLDGNHAILAKGLGVAQVASSSSKRYVKALTAHRLHHALHLFAGGATMYFPVEHT
jgi:D-serine dehydratase